MKKTYIFPTQRVVDLHTEDSLLINASQVGSGTTPGDLDPNIGGGEGTGEGPDLVKGQNLWDKEW